MSVTGHNDVRHPDDFYAAARALLAKRAIEWRAHEDGWKARELLAAIVAEIDKQDAEAREQFIADLDAYKRDTEKAPEPKPIVQIGEPKVGKRSGEPRFSEPDASATLKEIRVLLGRHSLRARSRLVARLIEDVSDALPHADQPSTMPAKDVDSSDHGLTVRQLEILRWISRFVEANGFAPTLREIGRAFAIGSTNGVNDHLHKLERKGYISRVDLVSRAIRITKAVP